MLTQPAVSAERIAFVYANDLWIADLDGPERPAADLGPGVGVQPRLLARRLVSSPSARQYDGNIDVFVVPAAGGVPKRLTWHPGADIVQGFTPDGKSVLFASAATSSNRAYTQLFTVPVDGGDAGQAQGPQRRPGRVLARRQEHRLQPLRPTPSPSGRTTAAARSRASGSSTLRDSRRREDPPARGPVATTPTRCGSATRSTSAPTATASSTSIAFDPTTKEVEQLTDLQGLPGPRRLGRRPGRSSTSRPAGSTSTTRRQGKAAALADRRRHRPPRDCARATPRGAQWVRGASLSPTGRAGRVRVPGRDRHRPGREGRPPQPHRHARRPRAHPGLVARRQVDRLLLRRVAASTSSTSAPQDGKGEAEEVQARRRRLLRLPAWSPDSAEDRLRRQLLDPLLDRPQDRGGQEDRLRIRSTARPARRRCRTSWSPDSKWIAYTLEHADVLPTRLRLLARPGQVASRHRRPERRRPSPSSTPSGKYLYFFASTDAGPAKQWFDQSNADIRTTRRRSTWPC